MPADLQWQHIQKIVLQTLSLCEDTTNSNEMTNYLDVLVQIEEVIVLLNQVYVQPMVHSNDNARDAIENILYNFNMLRRNFITDILRFGQTETILEHMRPSDIATILPNDHPVLERDVSEVECHSIGCAGRPEYSIPKFLLTNLRQIGYTWSQIADMLLVSRWKFIEEGHNMDWKGCNVFPI